MEEQENVPQQHKKYGNKIGVRVIAGILAILMVLSMATTIIAYLVR